MYGDAVQIACEINCDPMFVHLGMFSSKLSALKINVNKCECKIYEYTNSNNCFDFILASNAHTITTHATLTTPDCRSAFYRTKLIHTLAMVSERLILFMHLFSFQFFVFIFF